MPFKEFLYNINWYNAYYNYNKPFNIHTIDNIDYNMVANYTKNFIKKIKCGSFAEIMNIT